jgi:hypothetical protein
MFTIVQFSRYTRFPTTLENKTKPVGKSLCLPVSLISLSFRTSCFELRLQFLLASSFGFSLGIRILKTSDFFEKLQTPLKIPYPSQKNKPAFSAFPTEQFPIRRSNFLRSASVFLAALSVSA